MPETDEDKKKRMSTTTEFLRSLLGRGQKDSVNPNSRKLAEIEEEKKRLAKK